MIDGGLPGYERLQVVLSYDTDHRYNFRCLPGIITKRYLNRHVFKGKDRGCIPDDKQHISHIENEVYLGKIIFPLFGRQLYDLLGGIESVGEQDTFDELSDHAKDIAQLHNLFRRRQSHIHIQLLHEFIRTPLDTVCADLVTEVKKPNHILSLDETVRAQTLLLLGYNR